MAPAAPCQHSEATGGMEMVKDTGPAVIASLYGGLANRVRAAVSSMILAERLGRACRLRWGATSSLRCRFHDLFRVVDPRLVIEPSGEDEAELRDLASRGRLTEWRQPGPLFRAEAYDRARQTPLLLPSTCLRGLKDVLLVRACVDFRIPDTPAAEYHAAYSYLMQLYFRPVEDILDRVMDLPPDTVGIHVRRGDKYQSLGRRWRRRCSYPEDFLPAMNELVAADPAVRFFVASDDDGMKAYLERRYPGRTLTYEGVVQERETAAGMKDAVRDFWTLGHTRLLLFDGDSSFAPVAARYHNRPCRNMRATIEPPAAVNPLLWLADRIARFRGPVRS